MTRPPQGDRHAQLVASLAAVRRRLSAACDHAGRAARTITLIAVTKGFPASDIEILAELGVLDIGENRDQEARVKVAEVQAPVRWHFVGRLQTNKCRSVARYATAVHSIDRSPVAEALSNAAMRVQRRIEAFIQVSLDDDPARGGVPRAGVGELAKLVASLEGLQLVGIMAVAPMQTDPRQAFADLADISADLQVRFPSADAISAGMSDDLEAAVEFGATHVRIGSALLGRRTRPFG